MEALKARIAASARKAGMDTEFDSLEKLVKREPPPVVEWWDELLLGAESYDVLEQGTSQVDNPQGPITYFVQHPVQILPPWEKRKVEPQALKLTKKVGLCLLVSLVRGAEGLELRRLTPCIASSLVSRSPRRCASSVAWPISRTGRTVSAWVSSHPTRPRVRPSFSLAPRATLPALDRTTR
jgi:hypothetical protein